MEEWRLLYDTTDSSNNDLEFSVSNCFKIWLKATCIDFNLVTLLLCSKFWLSARCMYCFISRYLFLDTSFDINGTCKLGTVQMEHGWNQIIVWFTEIDIFLLLNSDTSYLMNFVPLYDLLLHVHLPLCCAVGVWKRYHSFSLNLPFLYFCFQLFILSFILFPSVFFWVGLQTSSSLLEQTLVSMVFPFVCFVSKWLSSQCPSSPLLSYPLTLNIHF